LIDQAGYLPLLIPNNKKIAKKILERFSPEGIIFTGGNSLVCYGGDSYHRDETESLLYEYANKNKVPILGVCRGMQLIQHLSGTPLVKVKDQVSSKQQVLVNGKQTEKNSYHTLASFEVSNDFDKFAELPNGMIKGIYHKKLSIIGVMWHPERNQPFDLSDITMIKELFN
jgi:putative glutamine amidotransferase